VRRLSVRFPGYGLACHVGYGTVRHREALRTLGPSPLHRRCFLRSLGTTGGNPPAVAGPPAT
jgi:ribonuclease HII